MSACPFPPNGAKYAAPNQFPDRTTESRSGYDTDRAETGEPKPRTDADSFQGDGIISDLCGWSRATPLRSNH